MTYIFIILYEKVGDQMSQNTYMLSVTERDDKERVEEFDIEM